MKSVVVGDVALEHHRRYVAAYLALPCVAERVRVQGFGLPDGNLWVVRPCSLTDEQRQAAVDAVRTAMAEKVIQLPRLSRDEAATLGRSMPRSAPLPERGRPRGS
jgi:hypothetical protein